MPVKLAHDVFVSYCHDDKKVADGVCAGLEAKRIRCWIAPRDVLAETEYAAAILDAIADCPAMVLGFSSHANQSPHTRREVERAVSKNKIIVPFRIDAVSPTGSMEYCLSNTHWLDAIAPPLDMRIAELAVTLGRLLAAPSQETQIGPPDETTQSGTVIVTRSELEAALKTEDSNVPEETSAMLEQLKLSIELCGTTPAVLEPSSKRDVAYASRVLQQIESLRKDASAFAPIRAALKTFLNEKKSTSLYHVVKRWQFDRQMSQEGIVDSMVELGPSALPAIIDWFLSLYRKSEAHGYYLPVNIQYNLVEVLREIGGPLAVGCLAQHIAELPSFDSAAMTKTLNALRHLLGSQLQLERTYEAVTGRKLAEDRAIAEAKERAYNERWRNETDR